MQYFHTINPVVLCPGCNSLHSNANPGMRIIGYTNPGWAFRLHVYDDIPTLEKWRDRWNTLGQIVITGGHVVSPDEMDMVITFPENVNAQRDSVWYDVNNAEPGLHGLAHLRIGYADCVGHGSTWDLLHKSIPE